MRKIFIIVALLFATGMLHAQNTQYSLVGGANFSKLKISYQSLDISSDMTVGFHAGLEVSSTNPAGNLRLRSGFLFSREGGEFPSFDYSGYGRDTVGAAKMEIFYGRVPLLLEYFPSEKFSLQGGINSDFLLNARLIDNRNKEIASGTEGWRKWVPGLTAGVNFYPLPKIGIRAMYDAALLSLNKEDSDIFKLKKSQITAGVHYTF